MVEHGSKQSATFGSPTSSPSVDYIRRWRRWWRNRCYTELRQVVQDPQHLVVAVAGGAVQPLHTVQQLEQPTQVVAVVAGGSDNMPATTGAAGGSGKIVVSRKSV